MGNWRVSGSQHCLSWLRGCRSRLGSEEEKSAALFETCCVRISNGDATPVGELSEGEIWRGPLDCPDVPLRGPRPHLQRQTWTRGPENISGWREHHTEISLRVDLKAWREGTWGSWGGPGDTQAWPASREAVLGGEGFGAQRHCWVRPQSFSKQVGDNLMAAGKV